MDQQEQQDESRQGQLATEPHLGEVTYQRRKPEASPDESLRLGVKTSIIMQDSGCVAVLVLGVCNI